MHVAEALLSFHAWYKLDAHWLWDKNENCATGKISAAVSRMMAMVKYFLPRKKGNAWKIQKFHDIFHLAVDMERFGSPRNFDCGVFESALKYWAKLPALTSQTRGYACFLRQAAHRIYEFLCMAKARRENGLLGVLDKKLPKLDECGAKLVDPLTIGGQPVLRGSHFSIFNTRAAGGGYIETKWSGSEKRRKGYVEAHPLVEEFFREEQHNRGDGAIIVDPKQDTDGHGTTVLSWKCYTECIFSPPLRCPTQPRLTFRCHPNYRNEGEFYDWVIVRFQRDNPTYFAEGHSHRTFFRSDCVPAKLILFVRDSSSGKICALVHACHFRTAALCHLDSVLMEPFQLEYHVARIEPQGGGRVPRRSVQKATLRLVEIDSIEARCFVVEEQRGIKENVPMPREVETANPGYDRVWLVRPRTDWGPEFV